MYRKESRPHKNVLRLALLEICETNRTLIRRAFRRDCL